MLTLHPERVHDVPRAFLADFHCERPMYARFYLRKLISVDKLSVRDVPGVWLLHPIDYRSQERAHVRYLYH